jgi:hypothetical protein
MRDFHSSRYVETRAVKGFIIFSAPQRRGEKYVFEYFCVDNVKIFIVNRNV